MSLNLAHHVHCNFGHFGIVRNFLTLSQRYYWKGLYRDVSDLCHSCDVCLRAKRNYCKQTPKLHPLPVPTGPGQVWSADFKPLVRPTKNGFTAILCLVDNFTSWRILELTRTQTAEETARVFLCEVIASHGVPKIVISDKQSASTAQFFKNLSKMLGFPHRTSASRTARSNELAESLVRELPL